MYADYYPSDRQILSLRFESATYDNNSAHLKPVPHASDINIFFPPGFNIAGWDILSVTTEEFDQ